MQLYIFINIFYLTPDVDSTPMQLTVVGTDYYGHLTLHACNHFPRDNPIMYEQHIYMFTRDPERMMGDIRDMSTGLEILRAYNIDTSLFVWHNQQGCRPVQNPNGQTE